MSAIVYGHYMEALVPGSFQENVSEVYRLNRLKTVKFPPPTMTATSMEACREIFRERSKEETQRVAEEERSGTHASRETYLEMDLDDEVIKQEGREIENMIKRHRESMTPPHRENKRKKQEEEAKIRQKPPQQPKQSTKEVEKQQENRSVKKR